VYFSNILGLPLGFFFIFTSLKFAPEKVSHQAALHAQQLMGCFTGLCSVGMLCAPTSLAVTFDAAW
jgi:hypothetical protein